MQKVFTKRELVAAVSEETNLPQTLIVKVFNATARIQKKQLKAGYVVKTQNGQIKIVTRKARKGTNPQNGKAIEIPSGKKPKFMFSKEFKESFNNLI